MSTRNVPAGRWSKCLGRFKMQTLTYCDATFMSTRTAAGQFKGQFKGAMEDMSGKVQNANTHRLGSQNHEHAHSSRSVQGPVQWGDGTLHMWGSIRGKAHPLPRNAQSNGQHFSGAMERYTVGSIRRKAHPLPHNTHSNGQHTSGAMEEISRQGQKVSAHKKQCCHEYCRLQS